MKAAFVAVLVSGKPTMASSPVPAEPGVPDHIDVKAINQMLIDLISVSKTEVS